MQHVMLDTETLGTNVDSAIISIGAVRFDLDSDQIDDQAFYASVSVDSNLRAGRSITEDTLLWWMRPEQQESRAVFFEPKTTLDQALIDFADWFGKATFIWSNGASFDIPMVKHAMDQCSLQVPWEFYNERCVRTYKNLPGMKQLRAENTGAHNAMHDALAQAKLVQMIQKKLTAGGHSMVKAK